MNEDRPKAFPIVRLWERIGKDGHPFLSGVMGGARVMIVKNKEKRDGDDSGWVMLMGPNHQDSGVTLQELPE